MTTWRRIDDGTLHRLLSTLAQQAWTWTAGDVPALARQLGWHILETLDGKGAVADAGWNVGDEEIELAYTSDRVNDITMRLTDTAPTKQPAAQQFLSDTFTAVKTTATGVLGTPTTDTLGKRPQARWRGPETTLVLEHAGAAINLTWANNQFQDRWDQLRDHHV